MTAQIGMPIQYTNDGSTIFPAVVSRTAFGVVSGVLWPAGGTPQWQEETTANGLVRDDALTTSNSWAPISFSATVTIESGV